MNGRDSLLPPHLIPRKNGLSDVSKDNLKLLISLDTAHALSVLSNKGTTTFSHQTCAHTNLNC